ncbi:MAG: archaeosine synthase subunit alpha, partial [Halobacteriota archaeon]
MTEYFEVVGRDGPARRGRLRLDPAIETPGLIGDRLLDYGSLWSGERETPDDAGDGVALLPHRAMPAGTPTEVVEARQVEHDVDFDGPTASVTSVDDPRAGDHDVYVLTGLREGDSRRVVSAAMRCRRRLPPDSALYLPAAASPADVGLLAYLGFDIFDVDHAVVAGHGGVYMTSSGERDVEEVDNLPCSCPVCVDREPEDLSPEDVGRHNALALEDELVRVRFLVQSGRLRDYLEGQVRVDRWQTEALRLLDDEHTYLERRTPVARTTDVDCNSAESLDRVEITRFGRRLRERYEAPRGDVAVLLPCSAGKPYSLSRSHSEFRSAVRRRAHEVVVTSPMGVVPRDLEHVYPAANYDTPVTGRWTPTEKEYVSGLLETYLADADYDRVVVHLPEDYRGWVKRACEAAGVDVEYT